VGGVGGAAGVSCVGDVGPLSNILVIIQDKNIAYKPKQLFASG